MIHPILRFTLANVYKLWLRKAQGLENLPKDRPFIIAANHSSYYDSMLLHCIIIPKIDKKIIIDLDGTTKDSYEQFRVGARFENVLENIKYFCQQKQILKLKKPFIELQFVLTKLNQDEVEDIKKIAEELKVDHLCLRSFNLGEYAYSAEEIKNLSDKFFPDTPKYQQKIRYQKEGDKLKIKSSPTTCPLARSHLVVLVDGSVAMCCYDLRGEYIYGNVFSHKLKEIWFDQGTKNRRQLAEKRQYPLCKICSIYK